MIFTSQWPRSLILSLRTVLFALDYARYHNVYDYRRFMQVLFAQTHLARRGEKADNSYIAALITMSRKWITACSKAIVSILA